MTNEQEMIFKPEPVAEVQTGTIRWHIDRSDLPNGTKLYAHPAPVAAPAPEDARDAPHIAPFRLLVAACNRLSAEAEEYTFDDGMGRGALQDYWDEFEAALERARESLND